YSAFRRIKVKDHHIRLVEGRLTHLHVVNLDARKIREPGYAGIFFAEYVLYLLIGAAQRSYFDPVWCVVGSVLLKPPLSVYPIRIPYQRQWPPFDMLQDCRRDAHIIGHERGLCDSIGRKEDLFEIGDFDLAPTDRSQHRLPHHKYMPNGRSLSSRRLLP